MNGRRSFRNGFTIIEFMVAAAVITVLTALLLPAVNQAREASRRIGCQNNLRQLGLALYNYEGVHRAFPPSKIAAHSWAGLSCDEAEEVEVEDQQGECTEYSSWTVMCLSFLDQGALATRYADHYPWSGLINRSVVSTPLAVFSCPSAPGSRIDSHHVRGAASTDYSAINQVERRVYTDVFGVPDNGLETRVGTLTEHEANPLHAIIDGTSQSILLAECAGRPQSYVFGQRMTAAQFAAYTDDEIVSVESGFVMDDGVGWADPEAALTIKGIKGSGTDVYGPHFINAINAGEVYSFHSGGAQTLLADGSVRFLSQSLDAWVFVSLCTRAGGEVVSGF